MMNSMIKENGVTFKQLEKNIYAWVCQSGRPPHRWRAVPYIG